LKQSGKRKTLPIDNVPQAILEEIADDHPQISGLMDAIQALPPDHAALISMVYLAGLTQSEAAKILKISRQAVARKIKFSIEIIRESLQ
jgi:RNA polymerase sigma factor (sigma-70 family)